MHDRAQSTHVYVVKPLQSFPFCTLILLFSFLGVFIFRALRFNLFCVTKILVRFNLLGIMNITPHNVLCLLVFNNQNEGLSTKKKKKKVKWCHLGKGKKRKQQKKDETLRYKSQIIIRMEENDIEFGRQNKTCRLDHPIYTVITITTNKGNVFDQYFQDIYV